MIHDDLITWLREQLDDEERATLEAPERHWRFAGVESCQVYVPHEDGGSRTIAWCANGYDDDYINALHIARHDPARVLAEVEAKRRILELHQRVDARPDWAGAPHATWWPGMRAARRSRSGQPSRLSTTGWTPILRQAWRSSGCTSPVSSLRRTRARACAASWRMDLGRHRLPDGSSGCISRG